MKKGSSKSSEKIRRDHNFELLRRMRNGEPLYSFDSQSSWYPPRPVIKKDKGEMTRLYRDGKVASERDDGGMEHPTLVVLQPRPDHDDQKAG